MDDLNALPLIPRKILFGNPERTMAKISPDGQWLSWLAPVNNVLNVWCAPIENIGDAKPVTHDTKRGIRFYSWAKNSSHIIFIQDQEGNEDWHIYAVELANNTTVNLTALEGITARFYASSWSFPDHIIIGLNDDNPSWHDVYKLNIKTGERELIFKNDQEISGFIFDEKFNLRFATKSILKDGGTQVYRYQNGGLSEVFKIGQDDTMTTNLLGFQSDNALCYMLDSRNKDKAALTTLDFETLEQSVLVEPEKVDLGNFLFHPTQNTIQAYAEDYLRQEWHILDPDIQEDFDFLIASLPGDIDISSRSKADDVWVVACSAADMPGEYFKYDRANKTLEKLFSTRPQLDDAPLRPMQGHVISSRDGLDLVSYLTLPPTACLSGEDLKITKPVPMVLLVHGGPWARDYYGYNPQHQSLANRGYAVLSVNFRGSRGFGKAFINAANLEWAGKMHDDLLDAVAWAIEQGITTPDQVAIMGGSYGGYATLVGLTFTPDVFACGVDIVGPSNLQTLIETIPPYWKGFFEEFATRMGDPRTDEGRQLLQDRSPLNKVEHISKPLLIAQGANDPRVKKSESDQIVGAMVNKNIPVTYVLFPDEGHGFARPENRIAFQAIAEAFLAEHLGGRFEPVGEDFNGSTTQILEGKDQIPSLAEAL